ncbi:unnamed protein product [Caenorhabditis nigoni]
MSSNLPKNSKRSKGRPEENEEHNRYALISEHRLQIKKILNVALESFKIAEKQIGDEGLNKRKKRPEIGDLACDLLWKRFSSATSCPTQ